MTAPLPFGLQTYPGWLGAFTRQEVAGAIPNGTRIMKIRNCPAGDKDAHAIGTLGVVLGSLHDPEVSFHILYFVEWDGSQNVACAVTDYKIGRAP